ncbi:flagellar export chaperone FlgN [Caproicibacter fermentans]|uniref:Flagellar export chaperone FlgN n=1 Tax=Caproicibacter fermentans TaxID=2576756 RepID=A0A7G8TFJ5_9FIRM|nr:flagellar export chaperone FlgN [Caproicibacter fermentans]QNK42386.1 flagellar export chaperone FlgN [Caproicibacter fermentans]
MMDKKTSGSLISYFEKLLDFYRNFLGLEKEKLDDLQNGRLDLLDECLKREQAFVLEARGLEQERAKLMNLTPQPDAKFHALIPQFPGECREQAQALFRQLSSVLTEMKETNRQNTVLLEQKIHTASAVIGKLKNRPELRKIYDEKIRGGNQPPAFLSTKI